MLKWVADVIHATNSDSDTKWAEQVGASSRVTRATDAGLHEREPKEAVMALPCLVSVLSLSKDKPEPFGPCEL